MTKRALLLGGTGAIGVYLAPELEKLGFEVMITSRSTVESQNSNITFIQGNAHDEDFMEDVLKERDYDVIIDFMIYATEEFRSRYSMLLESCRQYIFLSSYRVFADTDIITEQSPRLLDVSQDKEFLDTDEYALAKARQEDMLRNSKYKNWTIVRPSITYSKARFQFGTMETDTFIWRSLRGASSPIPSSINDKEATLTWAGDTARIISKLVLNDRALGDDFNISTNEHHTWSEVAGIYSEVIGLKTVPVSVKKYIQATGGGINDLYLIKYNRMYDRIIDNTKVLRVTGESQDSFVKLKDGLVLELRKFVEYPQYSYVDLAIQARFDRLTHTNVNLDDVSPESQSMYMQHRFPLRSKLRIRTRLKKIKHILRIRTRTKGFLRTAYLWGLRVKYARVDGAIVTLSGYYNYGNILQRYASQKFLKNNGLNFVSYWNEQNHGRTDADTQLKFTRDFVERYIDSKIYDPKDRFPAYMVGSDQVWRNWGYDDPKVDVGYYFLDFTHDREVRRVAYAASIGQDSLEEAQISEEAAKYLQPFAQQFDYVGVREASGVDILKKEWNVDAIEVLDPTMLLSKEEYSQLIDNNTYDLPNVDGTIFTYFILSNESKRAFVDRVIESKSLKENSIYLENKMILPPVEAWLKGIRDADLVVADSFHGIVFSIIFNTPFIVVESGTGGEARITTLLSKFGLSGRYITSTQADNYKIDELYNIDWISVNATLETLRKRDGNWLLNALSIDDGV